MAVSKNRTVLVDKFRGCLVGALLGDCLGEPYIRRYDPISKVALQHDLDILDDPSCTDVVKPYTDDTAMTRCAVESFIEKGCMDEKDLAQRFTDEYYSKVTRGYGGHVVDVFMKLRHSKPDDVFQPAREQFHGRGSYGNGGAMRIAPVALFSFHDFDNMLKIAKLNTMITHTNNLGVDGALLQCVAVYLALQMKPEAPFDRDGFLSKLISIIGEIEEEHIPKNFFIASLTRILRRFWSIFGESEIDEKPYKTKLLAAVELLKKESDGSNISDEEVIETLGNDVRALYSVPAAVYCFLRAHKEIPDIKTDNGFRRTIQYAISLGGDTDTIGSMAGAIAGAYYGYNAISKNLQKHCEDIDKIIELADRLYEVSVSHK